jgi:LCP family protein required for cell wall assembly
MKFIKHVKENFPKDLPTQIILVLMIVLAMVGAVFAYRLTRQLVSTNQTFALPGDPVIGDNEPDDDTDLPDSPKATEIPQADLPQPEPWDGKSRVNVLVMGLDYRDWEVGETPRTDTMILLTFDPITKTAGIVSIPRDLWVSIPGFEYAKINTAYYLGEVYNLPGGGAALAARTVEEFLGVPVPYYAQVDFQAFVDFIDHIEGVKLTLEEPIVLDRRGKDNSVTIDAGTSTFPGEYALAYVRTRTGEGGDFDRAARQQQVIIGIRDRILNFDMMPKLVARAPEIYNDLAAGINTNLSLNQVIRLAWSALEVEAEDISQVIIGSGYITIGKSPDGLDILKPVPDKIRLLRDEVFNTGGVLGPVAQGDSSELIAEESARVAVYNGSYQTDLHTVTASWFREQGLNIVDESNTDGAVYSQIFVYNSKPYALKWLSDTLNVPSTNIYNYYDPNAKNDIVVILGDVWASNNPMQ